MNAPAKPRWHHRFASFTNTIEKPREVAARRSLDYAVQIGLVQLFNITFEFARKLLKERMQNKGMDIRNPYFPTDKADLAR